MTQIRRSTESDIRAISRIHVQAFGSSKGPEITQLVEELFCDRTAAPILSLVAVVNDKTCGHILFTKVNIAQSNNSVSAQILAPLAVLPEYQKQGIGGLLIEEGLAQLRESGIELVFVLGHPDYYPRSGFRPAGALGFEPTHHIPEEHAEAWMVQELIPGIIGTVNGRVQCCEALDKPEYWRE